MSYLPELRPGMIVSKVALTTFAFSPITAARALTRSGSIPTTVWPSEAMNSSGAYVASAATVSTPFDLMAAGTSFSTAGSAAGAGAEVEEVPPPVEELEELEELPHPTIAATQMTDSETANQLRICLLPSDIPKLPAAYARRPSVTIRINPLQTERVAFDWCTYACGCLRRFASAPAPRRWSWSSPMVRASLTRLPGLASSRAGSRS